MAWLNFFFNLCIKIVLARLEQQLFLMSIRFFFSIFLSIQIETRGSMNYSYSYNYFVVIIDTRVYCRRKSHQDWVWGQPPYPWGFFLSMFSSCLPFQQGARNGHRALFFLTFRASPRSTAKFQGHFVDGVNKIDGSFQQKICFILKTNYIGKGWGNEGKNLVEDSKQQKK